MMLEVLLDFSVSEACPSTAEFPNDYTILLIDLPKLPLDSSEGEQAVRLNSTCACIPPCIVTIASPLISMS